MSKKKYVRDYIPNLDTLYNKVVEFVKEHQGEKGYIDTQDDGADTIYTFVYEDFSSQGEERIVYGVRVETGEDGAEDLQICFEPFMHTYKVIYDDNTFRGLNEDPDANAVWYSVRWSDVYYVPTIFSIAEAIEEYVEEEEPIYLDGKKWDELSEHDKGVISDLEM